MILEYIKRLWVGQKVAHETPWPIPEKPDLDEVLEEIDTGIYAAGMEMGPKANAFFQWYQSNPQGHPYEDTAREVTPETMKDIILWLKDRDD